MEMPLVLVALSEEQQAGAAQSTELGMVWMAKKQVFGNLW